MTKRFGTLILCITAIMALLAMSAMPALAHHKDDHDQGNGASHQQADNEASSSEAGDESEAKGSGGKDRSKGNSTEQSSTEQSSTDEEPAEDPEGKRYDGSGEPRGQTEESCPNEHEGNFSGNGANRHGPYDSTCDGSASKNGEGGGSAKGRPCAGCVGAADNKNPKGQYPDGNHDGNAGYECDGNKGVGRGNPAHTACEPSDASLPPDDVLGRTDEANPTKFCPDGHFEGMPMVDESDCEFTRDSVLPKLIRNQSTPLGNVAGRTVGAVGAVLPFTGAGDLYFATALGLLLIAAGAVGLKLRNNA